MEVDHVQPLRDAPELAFDLSNLQVLCRACHAAKTRIESGHAPASPGRRTWKLAVRKIKRKTDA